MKPHIGSENSGERYELNKLTSLPICGFKAQLVEQRTGIAKVTGSNSNLSPDFFFRLLSNCLIRKFTAMIILYFQVLYNWVDSCA